MTDCFDLTDFAVALLGGGGGLVTVDAVLAPAVIGRLNLLGG